MFISSMWDVKEPTHYSKRVGHEVPGVVTFLCESIAGPHQLIAAKTRPVQPNKETNNQWLVRTILRANGPKVLSLILHTREDDGVYSLMPALNRLTPSLGKKGNP